MHGAKTQSNCALSAADLLRSCGEHLTDVSLWAAFVARFQRDIIKYLLRALKYDSIPNRTELLKDLTQEVYLRLVRNTGTALRTFRGTTDFSVKAFLARVCLGVVADHFRQPANKLRQQDAPVHPKSRDSIDMAAILKLIDVQRLVEAEESHSYRNALIFKLHYVDGFAAKAIAAFPAFSLTEAGVTTILQRLRKRITSGPPDAPRQRPATNGDNTDDAETLPRGRILKWRRR